MAPSLDMEATMTVLATRQAPHSRLPRRRPDGLLPSRCRGGTTIGLHGLGTTVSYAHGKTVIEEGNPADYVYKVVAGSLGKVRLLPDGRRHITRFLMAGDFFGFAEGSEY